MSKPSPLFRPLAARCGRRDFLRGLLLGGGALASLGLLPGRALALAAPDGTTYTRTALFMGTVVRLHIAACGREQASEAAERALGLGQRLAAVFTRHDAASPVGLLNARGRLDDAPGELCALLRDAAAVHERLKSFDISVLPLLQWRERTGGRADAPEAREARELVDARHIRVEGGRVALLRQGMGITLDGIAKGAVVDAMSAELSRCGCGNHLVEAGGDIMARGTTEGGRPWRVAVEDPDKRGRYPAVLSLRDQAIATSGNYERPAGHLLDPESGALSGLRSCSVLAADCRTADALATGLSLLSAGGAVAQAEKNGASALAVSADGLCVPSAQWPA